MNAPTRVVPIFLAALASFAACSSSDATEPGDSVRTDSGIEDAATSSASADAGNSDASTPSPSGPPGTPVAEHGALRVSAGRIVDVQGHPYALRGMSLFWSQWGHAFWNASSVATLRADWHASVVRAAMGVESGGYLEDAEREKTRVKTVVDAAIDSGMYVIVDWHDHNADQHTAAAKAFFAEMADVYGARPNVVFEVWNEPIEVSWPTVKTYATEVVATIRAHGANNLVIVGSPHWSQDVDLAAADPLTDANVAYAIHFYANTGAHQAPLRAKAETARTKGVALFASEWGTSSADGNGTVNGTESRAWLDYLKSHDIGWCNWSLFDKPEAASALEPGASTTGPWGADSLTPSGTFVKAELSKP